VKGIWSANGDGPGTHVLIVGVGAYRNQVDDGKAPKAEAVPTVARSALSFAEWVCEAEADGQFHPPLRTIAAAVSEPGTPPGQVSFATPDGPEAAEDPSIESTYALIDAWVERLNSHPENRAIVYLAGHGLAQNTSFLLSEDYGKRRNDAYHGLIDIDGFYTTLQATGAATVLMLVDCCREFEKGVFQQLHRVEGETFGSVAYDELKNPRRVMIKATELGKLAKADRDGRTYFCDGLLFALRGAAVVGRDQETWHVTAATLATALAKATEVSTGKSIDPSWQADYRGDPPEIVRFTQAPEVEMQIKTAPGRAIFESTIAFMHPAGGFPDPKTPSAFTYKVKLPIRDNYIARATFDADAPFREGFAAFAAEYFAPEVMIEVAKDD